MMMVNGIEMLTSKIKCKIMMIMLFGFPLATKVKGRDDFGQILSIDYYKLVSHNLDYYNLVSLFPLKLVTTLI